jgi:hypothetical protein
MVNFKKHYVFSFIMSGLEAFMESQEAMYASYAAVSALVGVAAGYIIGRLQGPKVNAAEIAKETFLSEQETRRAELGLETTRESNKIELEKLRYGHANEEHQRKLDTTVQDREYEDRKTQEAREYERSQTQERRAYETTQVQEKRDHELALADRLVELKPVIQDYLAELAGIIRNPVDQGILDARQTYREETHDEYLEDYADNKFDVDDFDVEWTKERIEDLVDLKYPLEPRDAPGIPNELKPLLALFNK